MIGNARSSAETESDFLAKSFTLRILPYVTTSHATVYRGAKFNSDFSPKLKKMIPDKVRFYEYICRQKRQKTTEFFPGPSLDLLKNKLVKYFHISASKARH